MINPINDNQDEPQIQLSVSDVLVILGENASGKTSFLNLISGFINENFKLKDSASIQNLADIKNQLNKINFGICNKDILGIPDLMIKENLLFFDLLSLSNESNSFTYYFNKFLNEKIYLLELAINFLMNYH